MSRNNYYQSNMKLPQSAQDFINLIIKSMRYRKKIRLEVQRELTSHFEDELRDCADDKQKEDRARQLIEQFGDAKLLGILLRRAKKRCRPLWRTAAARTFQTIGIIIVCFIIYTVWFLSGKPAVTVDYLAELNRIVKPVADESQNAAPFFEKAVAACPNMPEGLSSLLGKSFFDVNETERQIIQEWVYLNSDALSLIAQGVERPYYWMEYKTKGDSEDDGSLFGILMPYLSEYRRMAYAICNRAQIKAFNGEYNKAFDDLITCYKFGRLIGDGEKTLVEQLVGIAIQAIAVGNIRDILSFYNINAEQLAVLQSNLTQVQIGQEFQMRLGSEKMLLYDEIQRCFTGDRLRGGHLYPKRIISWMRFRNQSNSDYQTFAMLFNFFHPNKAQTKQRVDEIFNLFEEVFKMSPAELQRKSGTLDIDSMIKGNIFLKNWMPTLGGVHKIFYRFRADVQSVPVIIAAQRFKIDEGQYPKDMAELQQSAYIKEIPIDPFSEEPLVYKKTNEGFTLYSIGYNFKDDGGQVYRYKDGKVQLWAEEGDAVFWPVQK